MAARRGDSMQTESRSAKPLSGENPVLSAHQDQQPRVVVFNVALRM